MFYYQNRALLRCTFLFLIIYFFCNYSNGGIFKKDLSLDDFIKKEIGTEEEVVSRSMRFAISQLSGETAKKKKHEHTLYLRNGDGKYITLEMAKENETDEEYKERVAPELEKQMCHMIQKIFTDHWGWSHYWKVLDILSKDEENITTCEFISNKYIRQLFSRIFSWVCVDIGMQVKKKKKANESVEFMRFYEEDLSHVSLAISLLMVDCKSYLLFDEEKTKEDWSTHLQLYSALTYSELAMYIIEILLGNMKQDSIKYDEDDTVKTNCYFHPLTYGKELMKKKVENLLYETMVHIERIDKKDKITKEGLLKVDCDICCQSRKKLREAVFSIICNIDSAMSELYPKISCDNNDHFDVDDKKIINDILDCIKGVDIGIPKYIGITEEDLKIEIARQFLLIYVNFYEKKIQQPENSILVEQYIVKGSPKIGNRRKSLLHIYESLSKLFTGIIDEKIDKDFIYQEIENLIKSRVVEEINSRFIKSYKRNNSVQCAVRQIVHQVVIPVSRLCSESVQDIIYKFVGKDIQNDVFIFIIKLIKEKGYRNIDTPTGDVFFTCLNSTGYADTVERIKMNINKGDENEEIKDLYLDGCIDLKHEIRKAEIYGKLGRCDKCKNRMTLSTQWLESINIVEKLIKVWEDSTWIEKEGDQTSFNKSLYLSCGIENIGNSKYIMEDLSSGRNHFFGSKQYNYCIVYKHEITDKLSKGRQHAIIFANSDILYLKDSKNVPEHCFNIIRGYRSALYPFLSRENMIYAGTFYVCILSILYKGTNYFNYYVWCALQAVRVSGKILCNTASGCVYNAYLIISFFCTMLLDRYEDRDYVPILLSLQMFLFLTCYATERRRIG